MDPQEELQPRAARRTQDQGGAADSDEEGDGAAAGNGAAAGGRKGGRGARGRAAAGGTARARTGSGAGGGEPGPPVDGAALRVDEWIVEVDDEGIPLIKVGGRGPCAVGYAVHMPGSGKLM